MHQECWGGLARLALAGVLHLAVVAPVLPVAGVADEQLIGVVAGDEGDPQLVLEYRQGRRGLARLALVRVLHLAVVAPVLPVTGVADEQLIAGVVGHEGDPQLVLEYRQGRRGLARLALAGVLHLAVHAPVLPVARVTSEQRVVGVVSNKSQCKRLWPRAEVGKCGSRLARLMRNLLIIAPVLAVGGMAREQAIRIIVGNECKVHTHASPLFQARHSPRRDYPLTV